MKMKTGIANAAPCRCVGGVDETGGYVGKVKLRNCFAAVLLAAGRGNGKGSRARDREHGIASMEARAADQSDYLVFANAAVAG
ncbi:conserved hypothetical protein [Mesorhizobium opportunistum WSM2075]|uniref:Uncharacterized protein n=1 Tax=Mesorhizobium opportunistum (strain LMG 24607 / HAMBI 3007 / WSM2075) TaxID=536019 RepID=F7YEB1_MESOW|nr:conserved hypothetical protein [Mesorhizobium opportunistum WSM2075]